MKKLAFSGIRRVYEKAAAMERNGIDVVRLESGQPPFDSPPLAKERTKIALDKAMVRYTSNYGLVELRKAIARKVKRENGITADPYNEILVTCGAQEAVFCTIVSLLNEADEIVIPQPSWPDYVELTHLVNGIPVRYSLEKEKGRFSVEPQTIAKLITDRTRMIVVSTPNNPTGAVFDRATLTEISTIAANHDLLVLSDEVYEKIVYDNAVHWSIGSFPKMHKRTITVQSFSKSYSMSGWRLGYAIATPEIIEAMTPLHQRVAVCACSFAQAGAIAALEESEDYVHQMLNEYAYRRNMVLNYVNKWKYFHWVPPQGAFYAFVEFDREIGMNCEELSNYILEKGHVAVVPGSVFGQDFQQYIRISFAAPREDLQEGLERMQRALSQL